MLFIALNLKVEQVKLLLNVQDKNDAQNEAQKFVIAHTQACSLSTSSLRLELRLGYNIVTHLAQARARILI